MTEEYCRSVWMGQTKKTLVDIIVSQRKHITKLTVRQFNARKGIEEWCSDCLKPKYVCHSCIYQLTMEELGYRPRKSRGETSLESESEKAFRAAKEQAEYTI